MREEREGGIENLEDKDGRYGRRIGRAARTYISRCRMLYGRACRRLEVTEYRR